MGTDDGINPAELIKDLESDLKSGKQKLAKAKLGSDTSEISLWEREVRQRQEKYDNAKETYGGDARKQRFVSGIKSAGTKTAIVAGAVGGAIGGAAVNVIGKGGSSGSSGGHEGSEEMSENSVTLLFLFAVITHLVDSITKFQRPGFMIFVYVAMIVFAYFFVFRMHIGGPEEISLMIVIALAYGLPYVISIFPNNQFMLVMSGLLFLIPILPIYLGMKFSQNSLIGKLTKWYMIFWVIIMIFYVLTTFSIDQKTETLVKNPLAGVQFVMSGVGNTVSKVSTSFQNTMNKAIAQATGQPYEGSEESRVGIYIEKIKPLESKYNKNSHIYVQAKIRAVNVKEPLRISTMCVITGVKQGVTKPSVLQGVVGNYDNIITCDLGSLPAGQYTVKVQADFEFEGSSDIEYTFVNADIKDDQYERLGIASGSTSVATYTGGPVALGLPSLTMPLRVYVEDIYNNNNADALNYPFGMSLENKWSQGKVVRGINYTLDTPAEIRLIDCTRDPGYSAEPNSAGRNEYHFIMNTSNAQESFDAIQCQMYAQDINMLLSDDANIRTFAGKARYEYMVEGTTMVVVEQ